MRVFAGVLNKFKVIFSNYIIAIIERLRKQYECDLKSLKIVVLPLYEIFGILE